jgi:transposase
VDTDIRVDGEQIGRFRGQEPKSLPQEATYLRRRRRVSVQVAEKRPMKDTTISGADREVRAQDETYKRNAVEISLRGDRTIKQVAGELGVSTWVLYRWRKQYGPALKGAGPAPQTMEEKDVEIRRLRAEVVRLREREIVLKKSLGILSETPESGMPGSRR